MNRRVLKTEKLISLCIWKFYIYYIYVELQKFHTKCLGTLWKSPGYSSLIKVLLWFCKRQKWHNCKRDYVFVTTHFWDLRLGSVIVVWDDHKWHKEEWYVSVYFLTVEVKCLRNYSDIYNDWNNLELSSCTLFYCTYVFLEDNVFLHTTNGTPLCEHTKHNTRLHRRNKNLVINTNLLTDCLFDSNKSEPIDRL